MSKGRDELGKVGGGYDRGVGVERISKGSARNAIFALEQLGLKVLLLDNLPHDVKKLVVANSRRSQHAMAAAAHHVLCPASEVGRRIKLITARRYLRGT